MSVHATRERPPYDQVLVDIADYVCNYTIESELAYTTARNLALQLRQPAITQAGNLILSTHLPRNGHNGLSRERRHARKRAADGGAELGREQGLRHTVRGDAIPLFRRSYWIPGS